MTAQSIAERHITRREHDFTIEFALDVYILSADQLAGLIQQEAQRYMRDNRSIVDIAEYIGDFGVQR